MASFDAVVAPHNIATKQLNSFSTSLASRVVIYSWLSACPVHGDGAIQKSPEHLWTSDRQRKGTAKAAWVTSNTDICLKC